MAYGASADEAMRKAETLALRVIADRLENQEMKPLAITITTRAA